MKKKLEYEESSGNVFADLGLANPEESLAKAEVARQIGKLIKKRRLSQTKAAAMLGIDQPKVSALLRGYLTGFSLERLFRFLNALGQDVHIDITQAKSNHGYTLVNVLSSGSKRTAVHK